MTRAWAGVAAIAVLAGCDGIVLSDASQDYLDAFNANTAQVNRVAAMSLATGSEVPTTGTLTYNGHAAVAVDTNPLTASVSDTSLIGNARITANFGGDDMTGVLDNFVGIMDGQPAAYYNGTLSVTGGDLRVLTASQFGANIDGVIFDGNDALQVDGSIIGNFRSTAFRDVAGLSAITTGGTDFIYNGTQYGGQVAIVAERP